MRPTKNIPPTSARAKSLPHNPQRALTATDHLPRATDTPVIIPPCPCHPHRPLIFLADLDDVQTTLLTAHDVQLASSARASTLLAMLAVALPQPVPTSHPRPLPLAAFTPRISRPATNVKDPKSSLGGWSPTITQDLLQQYLRKTIASASSARNTAQTSSVAVDEEVYRTFRGQLLEPSVPESVVTSEVWKDWVKSRLEQGKKVCDSCVTDPGQCQLPDEHPGLDCSACIEKSTHCSWRRDFVVWASAREFGVSCEEAAVLYDKYNHEESQSAAAITDTAAAPAKLELKGDVPSRATSVQAAPNVDVEVDVYAYTDADAEGELDEEVHGIAEPRPVGEAGAEDEFQLLAKEADVEVFIVPDDEFDLEPAAAMDVDEKIISQLFLSSTSPTLRKRVTRANPTTLPTPTSTSKTTRRRAPESTSISQLSPAAKPTAVSVPAPAPASPPSQKRPRPDHDDSEQHRRPKRIPKPSEKIRAMSSVSTSSSLFGSSLSISAPAGAKGKGKASAKGRVKVEDEIKGGEDSVSAGIVAGKGLKRGRGRPPGVSGGKKGAGQGEDDEELGDGEVVVVRAKRPRLSGPSTLALPSTTATEASHEKVQNGPVTAFVPGDEADNGGGREGDGAGSLPTPTSSAPSPPSVHPTPSASTSAAPTARGAGAAPSASAPAAPQEPPRRPRGRPRKNPLPPSQATPSTSATIVAPFVPSPLVEGALALRITDDIDLQALKEHFVSLRDGYNQLHTYLSTSPPSSQPEVQSKALHPDTSVSISSEPDDAQTLRTELDQTKSSHTNTLAQLAKSQSELAKARKKVNKDNASSRQELEQSRRELESIKGQLEQAKGEVEEARRREEWWAWERAEMQRRLGVFPAAVGGAGLSYGGMTASASGGWGTQDWFWTSQAQNQNHGQTQTNNGSQNTYGSSYASSNFVTPSPSTSLTFGAPTSPAHASTSSSTTSSSQTANLHTQPHAQPQSQPHAALSSSLALSPQGPTATSLSPYHYGPVAWGYVQPNFDPGLGKQKEAGSGGKVQGGKQGKKQTKKKHLSFVGSEAGAVGASGGAGGVTGAASTVPATASSSASSSTAILSQAQAVPQATPGTALSGMSDSRHQLQGPGQPPSSAQSQPPSIAQPQPQPQIYGQPRSQSANKADDSHSLSRLESQLQALAQVRVQAGAHVQPQGSIHSQIQPQTQRQTQTSSEKQPQPQPHSLTQTRTTVQDKPHPPSYLQTPTQVQSEPQSQTRTQAKEQPHAPTPTYPEAYFSPFPVWPPLDVDMSASTSGPAPSSSQSSQPAQPSPAASNTKANAGGVSAGDKFASTLASALGTTIDPRTLAVSSSTLSSAFMKNLDPSLRPPMATATTAGLTTPGGGSTTSSAPAPASALSATPTATNATTAAAAAASPGSLTSQQQMKASFGWMGGSYSHS